MHYTHTMLPASHTNGKTEPKWIQLSEMRVIVRMGHECRSVCTALPTLRQIPHTRHYRWNEFVVYNSKIKNAKQKIRKHTFEHPKGVQCKPSKRAQNWKKIAYKHNMAASSTNEFNTSIKKMFCKNISKWNVSTSILPFSYSSIAYEQYITYTCAEWCTKS